MAKFDTIYRGDEDPRKAQQRMTASAASELILSKDQLYEMFQNILGIKKFEHQLLYQACQVSYLTCMWHNILLMWHYVREKDEALNL